MTRYHVNSEGKHGRCEAQKVSCPFAHGDSVEEACSNYEKSMSEYESDPLKKERLKDLISKISPEELENARASYDAYVEEDIDDREAADTYFHSLAGSMAYGGQSEEVTQEMIQKSLTGKTEASRVIPFYSDKGHLDTSHPLTTHSLALSPTYKKTSQVTMRIAEPGEKLTTTLADGTVETERILDGGEYIVKNPGGEEYAMSQEKFQSRYDDAGNGIWQAKGEVRAVKNFTGKDITIMAPWGEEQHGGRDCYIVEADSGERYIIGDQEFKDTYAEKKFDEAEHEDMLKSLREKLQRN